MEDDDEQEDEEEGEEEEDGRVLILALQIFQVLAAGTQIVLEMRIRTPSSDYKRDSQRDQKDLKGSVSSSFDLSILSVNSLEMGSPPFIHFYSSFLSQSVITQL